MKSRLKLFMAELTRGAVRKRNCEPVARMFLPRFAQVFFIKAEFFTNLANSITAVTIFSVNFIITLKSNE